MEEDSQVIKVPDRSTKATNILRHSVRFCFASILFSFRTNTCAYNIFFNVLNISNCSTMFLG